MVIFYRDKRFILVKNNDKNSLCVFIFLPLPFEGEGV